MKLYWNKKIFRLVYLRKARFKFLPKHYIFYIYSSCVSRQSYKPVKTRRKIHIQILFENLSFQVVIKICFFAVTNSVGNKEDSKPIRLDINNFNFKR